MPIILDHKKVFISQPMNGRPDGEVFAERTASLSALQDLIGEFEPIDSFIHDEPPSGVVVPLWYFAKSIEFMSGADIACFVGDWQNARGCRLEHEIATKYGLTVIEI